MRYARYGGNRKHGSRILRIRVLVVVVLCLAVLMFVLVDQQVRPMIKLYGNNQTVTAATKAVNDAVSTILSNKDVEYDSLVNIGRDADGAIVSVETNSGSINMLKSAVSEAIIKQLDGQEMQKVSIPMGSLIGGLMTGRGPKITIRIPTNATVETNFESVFEGAGINQTRHEIMLNVKVVVYAVVQGEESSTEVSTKFSVAESILVGEVPQWMVHSSATETTAN